MSQSSIYNGYSGVLWRSIYVALADYNNLLKTFSTGASGSPSLATIALASQGMLTSLENAVEAIDAFALNNAWSVEIGLLQQIQALPLTLDPVTLAFVNNRISAYEAINGALAPLIPQPPYGTFATTVAKGNPLLPSIDLLDFFEDSNFETEPVGLTGATLITQATACANAFLTLANAIQVLQGANIDQRYDVAFREYLCAQSAANLLADMTSGPFSSNVDGVQAWNQVVSEPAMVMCADTLTGAAYTFQLQEQAVLRNAMLNAANQIADLLLSLRQPLFSNVNLTVLRVGETLIDVAARELGNFELWPEIATLNGLSPPYVGPVAMPGIAAFGSELLLPNPGASVSSLGNKPSYSINFLGTDLYLGPINGDMPPWTGDFQIISGLSNLKSSLGRRLQTTQGTLIYHKNFGSRIPPEVGNIMTDATAQHINAFGKSALQSDPRVQRVLQSQTIANASGVGQIDFTASVLPSGFSTTPLAINEVISPTP